MKSFEKEAEELLRRVLTAQPNYPPRIKRGWVRKHRANCKRIERFLKLPEGKEKL